MAWKTLAHTQAESSTVGSPSFMDSPRLRQQAAASAVVSGTGSRCRPPLLILTSGPCIPCEVTHNATRIGSDLAVSVAMKDQQPAGKMI